MGDFSRHFLGDLMSFIDVDSVENELQIKKVLFAVCPWHILYKNI